MLLAHYLLAEHIAEHHIYDDVYQASIALPLTPVL